MVSYYSYPTKQGRRWLVSYRTPARRQTKKRGFQRKLDAVRWAAVNVTTPEADGTYIPASLERLTVRQVFEDLWQSMRGSWKPNTARIRANTWKNHIAPAIGGHPLMAVTRAQLEHITGCSSSNSLGRDCAALLGLIWRHGKSMGLKPNLDIVRRLPVPPRPEHRRRYLTMGQLVDVSRAADRYGHGLLVLTLGLSGLRWGEATGLQVKNLDVKNSVIHVDRAVYKSYPAGRWIVGTPKSGKSRSVPVPCQLMRMLAELVKGRKLADLVFPGRDGGFQNRPEYARGWWRYSLRRAGIPYTSIHSLRHTAASLAVASGADVKVLQNMMGHASAAMTLDVYSDLFAGKDRDVADRLGRMLDAELK